MNTALIGVVGPHAVKTGQKVFISDKRLHRVVQAIAKPQERPLDVKLEMIIPNLESIRSSRPDIGLAGQPLPFSAWTALFAGDPTRIGPDGHGIRFGQGSPPVPLVRDRDRLLGCSDYPSRIVPQHAVVVVQRGGCTFLEKLQFAVVAGAAGVIVMNTDDNPLNPSADDEDLERLGSDARIDDAALVVVNRTIAEHIQKMMDITDDFPNAHVMVQVDQERGSPSEVLGAMLYVNGNAVVNAILGP